jgi:protein-disulfide isomerase
VGLALITAILATSQTKPKTAHAAPAAKTTTASSPSASPAAAGAASLPSEETVTAFLRETYGYLPSFSSKITSIKPSAMPGLAEVSVVLAAQQGQQAWTFYVSQDGQHAVVGEVVPFGAQPYAPAQEKLKAGVNGVSRGPEKAEVTIVEFSDLQCPHCKQANPTVEKLMGDEPAARLVFQQFPLPMHNWAAKAAAYADCIGRSNHDSFWKFIQATFDAQADITEANADDKLTAIANTAGANGAEAAACAAKPDTRERIDKSVALGQAVDVTGTPTLFINGRKITNINGMDYEVLKRMVEFAAKPGS